MKRYWKLIVLVVVIVLTVGTFYMKQSLTSSNDPEMVLQTKSGDAKVAGNLTLNTNIGAGEGRIIDVTIEGSTSKEDNFISKVKGSNQDPKIARLQQDHRNFMRDKDESLDLFVEDENSLVYADAVSKGFRSSRENNDINVDWLDKKADNRSTFHVQLPEHETYSDVYVEHVYLADGQLKIITQNRKNASDATDTELHVYTIDRDAEKIVDDDKVLAGSENMDRGEWVNIYTVTNEENHGKTDTLILVKKTGMDSETDDSIETQMVYYDLQTKKRKKLSLPSDMKEQAIEAFYGTTLYYSEKKNGKASVTAYDVNDQKITAKHTINIPDSMHSPEGGPMTYANDGKLYIVSNEQKEKQATSVIIVDLKSGKTVYEGTIVMDDAVKNNDLFIYGISFQGERG